MYIKERWNYKKLTVFGVGMLLSQLKTATDNTSSSQGNMILQIKLIKINDSIQSSHITMHLCYADYRGGEGGGGGCNVSMRVSQPAN